MSKLVRQFLSSLLFVRNSIAFYPAILAAGLTVLGVLSIALEEQLMTKSLLDKLPILVINDPDTARSILNTMIGGIISLMVFSFSMVMILLNQASSNYSPRLLPGLITNKKHQIVLGFYLGTILFSILCSINVLPGEGKYTIPSLSILLGILLSIMCLILFIYFIHSISESIQISNIVKNLYDDGVRDLEKLQKEDAVNPNHDLPVLHELHADRSGYLVSVSMDSLLNMAEELDLHIEIQQAIGLFLRKGDLAYKVSRPLNEADQEKLINCLHFNVNESVNSSHFSTIKNLTEIALKAMSPGINDPGTALLAINYLTLLIAKRMQLDDKIFFESTDDENEKTGRVSQCLMSFDQLIFYTFGELRTYVAHDQLVVSKIIDGIDYLIRQKACADQYYQVLERERKVFLKVSKQALQSEYDYKKITS